MIGWRCTIGAIIPPDNRIIDSEFNAMAPDGVAVCGTRLPSVDRDEMPADAEGEATNLGDMNADVIAYACNASSFVKGVGSDEEIADRLARAAGAPATTASTAMVRALSAVGAETVTAVTPYEGETNDKLRRFLTGNGFEIGTVSGLGIRVDDVADGQAIDAQSADDTFRRVRANDASGSDAALVVATNLESVARLGAMESDLGKPVISANAALFWHALRSAGVNERIDGYGTLLREH